jgi:hypothetical protein
LLGWRLSQQNCGALIPNTGLPGVVVRAVGALAVIAAPLVITNRMVIAIVSKDGTPILQPHQVQLGVIIFAGAFISLLLWSVGAA